MSPDEIAGTLNAPYVCKIKHELILLAARKRENKKIRTLETFLHTIVNMDSFPHFRSRTSGEVGFDPLPTGPTLLNNYDTSFLSNGKDFLKGCVTTTKC